MTPFARGLIVAAIHAGIMLAIAGKYSWDRAMLPRAWAPTINYDPNLPVRGRYLSLSVVVNTNTPPIAGEYRSRMKLLDSSGRLTGAFVRTGGEPVRAVANRWVLVEPVPFFIADRGLDEITRLQRSNQIWVELTVPPKGAPRAVRIGVMRHGRIEPFALD